MENYIRIYNLSEFKKTYPICYSEVEKLLKDNLALEYPEPIVMVCNNPNIDFSILDRLFIKNYGYWDNIMDDKDSIIRVYYVGLYDMDRS